MKRLSDRSKVIRKGSFTNTELKTVEEFEKVFTIDKQHHFLQVDKSFLLKKIKSMRKQP